MVFKKKYKLIPSFCIIISASLFAQNSKTDVSKIITNRKVVVYSNDTVSEVEIASTNIKKKAKHDQYYSWYRQKTIWQTQGVFDGNLLHGSFKKYDPEHRLIVKGKFKYGLKHGEWHYLNRAGGLEKFEVWKKGKLTRPFSVKHFISYCRIASKSKKTLNTSKSNIKKSEKAQRNAIPPPTKILQDDTTIRYNEPIYPSQK